MTPIHDIVQTLIGNHNAVLLSEIAHAPSDIDFFIDVGTLKEAGLFLEQNGFVSGPHGIGQRVYRRFENGLLYIIDLVSDMNIYTTYLPHIRFSTTGSAAIGKDPILHKCLKYICTNRTDKIAFLDTYKNIWASAFGAHENFEFGTALPVIPVHATTSDILKAIHHKNALTARALRWKARLGYIGKGISIAFIGPDGSGKTFIIDKMRLAGRTKVIYMGDWFFGAQIFYNFLLRIPSPLNRFIYILYVIENYLRAAKVFLYKSAGYAVLIDRFPGTNRNAAHKGTLGRINRFIFKIFPKPDLIALLMAPPDVIYSRKTELSPDQIDALQVALKGIIQNENHAILDTEKLDEALNFLLAQIYHHKR